MGSYLPGLNFPIYSGWTQYTPVIPKLYWDVYSAEQRMKQLCRNFDKVERYLDYVAKLMNEWNIEFSDDIKNEFEKMWYEINNGLENAAKDWIAKNLEWIYLNTIRQIYFGINLEGHFVAYVPDSWNDIIFDTGMDYTLDTYGHLILRMDVDSPYDTVDQTPEIVRPIENQQLNVDVKNIMNTLYSKE